MCMVKIDQKWPEIHKLCIYGQNMAMISTKIDMGHISATITLFVGWENNEEAVFGESGKLLTH